MIILTTAWGYLQSYVPRSDVRLEDKIFEWKYPVISSLPLLLSRFIIKSGINIIDTLLKVIKQMFTFKDSSMINKLELITKL